MGTFPVSRLVIILERKYLRCQWFAYEPRVQVISSPLKVLEMPKCVMIDLGGLEFDQFTHGDLVAHSTTGYIRIVKHPISKIKSIISHSKVMVLNSCESSLARCKKMPHIGSSSVQGRSKTPPKCGDHIDCSNWKCSSIWGTDVDLLNLLRRPPVNDSHGLHRPPSKGTSGCHCDVLISTGEH